MAKGKQELTTLYTSSGGRIIKAIVSLKEIQFFNELGFYPTEAKAEAMASAGSGKKEKDPEKPNDKK